MSQNSHCVLPRKATTAPSIADELAANELVVDAVEVQIAVCSGDLPRILDVSAVAENRCRFGWRQPIEGDVAEVPSLAGRAPQDVEEGAFELVDIVSDEVVFVEDVLADPQLSVTAVVTLEA